MSQNNEKITILRGPERIRRRAAVLFGDDGAEGVRECLSLLVEVFASPLASGSCKHLRIKRSEADVITLEGEDPGLYLCPPDAPTDAIWQEVFCNLHTPPRDPYEYSLMTRQDLFAPTDGDLEGYSWSQLHLYGAQCASEFFDVRVRRDGWEYSLHFEKGENKGGLTRKAYRGPSGTCFTFRPDGEVFRENCLPAEALPETGRLLSLAYPGLSVTVLDEKLGLEQVFCCPNGILDALPAEAIPVYTAAGYAKGKERYDREEYEASVRLALTFCPEGGAECIHNKRWLPLGGTHLDALYKRLRVCLEARLGCKLTLKKVKACAKLVLVTDAEETLWVNGSRKSIQNTLLRDMTEDTLEENFLGYLDYHREMLRALFV